MADITVSIPISDINYTTWLRTSYIASAIVTEAGIPMIENIELGADQGDALSNLLTEAAREVLKIFTSRQGDVNGTPFEQTSTNIIYRFNEAEPILPQSNALKSTLDEDVKNAIFVYVTYLWFQYKGNKDQASYMIARYMKLTSNINRHLHRLHD